MRKKDRTNTPNREATLERELPLNAELEEIVLGCFLLFGGDLLDRTKLTSEHFGLHSTRLVYEELLEINEEGIQPDLALVTGRLREKARLDEVGGAAWLTSLITLPASSAMFPSYEAELDKYRKARSGIVSCIRAAAEMRQDIAEVDRIIAQHIGDLTDAAESKRNVEITREVFDLALAGLAERMNGGGHELGIATGVPAWDRVLYGIFPAEMILLGARPKVGKTALIETAIATQIEIGLHVAVFQKDMSPLVFVERMACRRARVVYERYKTGLCSSGELADFRDALAKLRKCIPYLHIFDPKALTASELAAIVRRCKRDCDLKVFYLDHFQTLQTYGRDRVAGLTEASQKIREVINDTGVPGVIIAQINNDATKEGRPRSSMFKYCDQLFSDCDKSLLMWSEQDEKQLKPNERQDVYLTVDANRMGGTGDEIMRFHRELMIFEQ